MGGGGKGGSADPSGMYEAMASVNAANQAYALGEQQFQWSQQVWNQMQPLVTQSEQTQIDLAKQQEAAMAQSQAESQAQWQQYEQYYAPLEQQYVQQAQNWASPQAMATARAQAMANVGEQGMAGVNTAAETLRGYGINPSSPRYASLYTSAQPMIGAEEAAAGTTAAQNLRLQQMELESGAINTGRGLVNSVGQLTQAGTGAGSAGAGAASGAGNTAFGNLSGTATGAGATSSLFNAGSNAMNQYVNAVNGYNNSQAAFNEAGASEMGGLGSGLGGILGLIAMKAKGGSVSRYADGGPAIPGIPIYPGMPSYQTTPDQGGGATGIPSSPMQPRQFYDDGGDVAPGPTVTYPTGQSQQLMVGQPRYTPLTAAQRQASPDHLGPMYSRTQGRAVINDPRAAPFADPRTFPAWQQHASGGDVGATPGGTVPIHASPSMGVATDDVPAMLTAHEFVIPKDVAVWKGHQYFAGQIDKARKEQQQFAGRGDIGGEPTAAIPQSPTFVSRPAHAMGGAIPAYPG